MIDQQAPHPCLCDGAAFCEECHLACHCSSGAETFGVTAGETAQQEIERVRESAGRTIGELREEIADLKGVIASLQRTVTRLTAGQETCPHGNDPEMCLDEACNEHR
jgi:hypothetical protein